MPNTFTYFATSLTHLRLIIFDFFMYMSVWVGYTLHNVHVKNQGQLAGVGFLIPLCGSNAGLQVLLAGTFTLQVIFPTQWLLGQREVDVSVLGAVDNLHGYWLYECACEFTQGLQVFWYSCMQTRSIPGSLHYLRGGRTQHEKHPLIWSPGWKYAERGKRENIKGKRWKQR